jgi:hypothetical protein
MFGPCVPFHPPPTWMHPMLGNAEFLAFPAFILGSNCLFCLKCPCFRSPSCLSYSHYANFYSSSKMQLSSGSLCYWSWLGEVPFTAHTATNADFLLCLAHFGNFKCPKQSGSLGIVQWPDGWRDGWMDEKIEDYWLPNWASISRPSPISKKPLEPHGSHELWTWPLWGSSESWNQKGTRLRVRVQKTEQLIKGRTPTTPTQTWQPVLKTQPSETFQLWGESSQWFFCSWHHLANSCWLLCLPSSIMKLSDVPALALGGSGIPALPIPSGANFGK